MSDKQTENTQPEEEERKGDCLTPSATIFVFLVMVLVQIAKWVLA